MLAVSPWRYPIPPRRKILCGNTPAHQRLHREHKLLRWHPPPPPPPPPRSLCPLLFSLFSLFFGARMIRCRRHHDKERESGGGVCPSCLRERLQTLLAAQSRSKVSIFASLFGRNQGVNSQNQKQSHGGELPRIMPTPTRKALPGRSIMGLAVCLSPLVRSNPVSGDPKASPCRRRQSELCHNRSRKMVDFGRFRWPRLRSFSLLLSYQNLGIYR